MTSRQLFPGLPSARVTGGSQGIPPGFTLAAGPVFAHVAYRDPCKVVRHHDRAIPLQAPMSII